MENLRNEFLPASSRAPTDGVILAEPVTLVDLTERDVHADAGRMPVVPKDLDDRFFMLSRPFGARNQPGTG